MATYLDLFGLGSDSDLQDKIVVAVIKKAQTLLDVGTPTTDQVTWASGAIDNPSGKAKSLLQYVLAANSGMTVAQIQGASDAAIQSNVDSAVDALIAGGAV